MGRSLRGASAFVGPRRERQGSIQNSLHRDGCDVKPPSKKLANCARMRGMSMDVGNSKGPKGDINVTPLIDVVLVLLIIFMVLTPSMMKHLTAIVPKKAENSAPAVNNSAVIVEYTANRELTVNNEPVAAEALANKITERLQGTRQKTVFFKAEDAALYGEVIRLMDIARGAGAQTLAVVTH